MEEPVSIYLNVKGKSGIYVIRHIESGKTYVGSSVDLYSRWRQHRTLLKHKKHHSIKLQRAWDKYGQEAFEFVVIQEVSDFSKILEIEQQYIDKLQSWENQKGYNILQKTQVSSYGRTKIKQTIHLEYPGDSAMFFDSNEIVSKKVEATQGTKTYRGWVSGDTEKQVSVSDANWKRLGQFSKNKVQLIRRSIGLIVTNQSTAVL